MMAYDYDCIFLLATDIGNGHFTCHSRLMW